MKKLNRVTTSLFLLLCILISSLGISNISFAADTNGMQELIAKMPLVMEPFVGKLYSGDEYDKYLADHLIQVESARTRTGSWSGSHINNILDMSQDTYWETGSEGGVGNRNWVDVTLSKESEIGRLLYGRRWSPLKR